MEKQSHDHNTRRLPEIVVGGTDRARLTSLANAAFDTVPDTAEELLSELDRARKWWPTRRCRAMWCAWARWWNSSPRATASA